MKRGKYTKTRKLDVGNTLMLKVTTEKKHKIMINATGMKLFWRGWVIIQ